jgi:hypothetical protein
LLAVAKEATPEAQLAKVGAISSAKTAAKAKNQTAATNVVEANHLTGAVNRFAEFCRANSPASVAAGIMPGEFAEVRVCIAEIRGWLDQFLTAQGISRQRKVFRHGPDSVSPAKHEPVAAASDLWRDLDIPTFLDRRGKGPADASKPSTEVPAL